MQTRLFMLVPALVGGWLLSRNALASWTDSWVAKDGRQATATIGSRGPKGGASYTYEVEGQRYTGSGYSSRCKSVECPLYYSTSHPWLSTLEAPALSGAPVWTFVLTFFLPPPKILLVALEIMFIATIINPSSRWGLRLQGVNDRTASGDPAPRPILHRLLLPLFLGMVLLSVVAVRC